MDMEFFLHWVTGGRLEIHEQTSGRQKEAMKEGVELCLSLTLLFKRKHQRRDSSKRRKSDKRIYRRKKEIVYPHYMLGTSSHFDF